VIDTFNRFMVGASASSPSRIQVARPPLGSISREEALNLAAWLVAMTDPARQEFDALLKAVLGEK
jgi:hypothetical protein